MARSRSRVTQSVFFDFENSSDVFQICISTILFFNRVFCSQQIGKARSKIIFAAVVAFFYFPPVGLHLNRGEVTKNASEGKKLRNA